MIPFAAFKLLCAVGAGVVLGVFLFYQYLGHVLKKWADEEYKRRIEEDEIYG